MPRENWMPKWLSWVWLPVVFVAVVAAIFFVPYGKVIFSVLFMLAGIIALACVIGAAGSVLADDLRWTKKD